MQIEMIRASCKRTKHSCPCRLLPEYDRYRQVSSTCVCHATTFPDLPPSVYFVARQMSIVVVGPELHHETLIVGWLSQLNALCRIQDNPCSLRSARRVGLQVLQAGCQGRVTQITLPLALVGGLCGVQADLNQMLNCSSVTPAR